MEYGIQRDAIFWYPCRIFAVTLTTMKKLLQKPALIIGKR